MSLQGQTPRFRIEGMDCASCGTKVDTAVRWVPTVDEVSVSVVPGTMTVKHHGASPLETTSLGYRTTDVATRAAGQTKKDQRNGAPVQKPKASSFHAHDHSHDHEGHADVNPEGNGHGRRDRTGTSGAPSVDKLEGMHGHDHALEDGPWWKSTKARLTILWGIAVFAAFAAGRIFPAVEQWSFIIAMFVCFVPIARRAWMGAINGSPFSIDTAAACGRPLWPIRAMVLDTANAVRLLAWKGKAISK